MKKIYASMAASIMALAVNAQTLTQATQAPALGDQYGTKRADSVNIAPGASGAGVTWNFGTLNIFNNLVSNYTVMASSTQGYPVGSQVAAASVSDQTYYMSTAADLHYYGGNFKVQAALGSLTYTSAAIVHAYPMSLNTASTAAIGGSINITSPTSLQGTFTGNSSTLADGSGTLILPGGALGTYTNVLRVMTTQTLNYSAGFVSGVITKVNYDYFTPTIKSPLVTIATFTLTSNLTGPSTQTMVSVNKDYLMTATSINSNKSADVELSVFPNPSNSLVNFVTADKSVKEVRIFDLTGKLLDTKAMVEGSLKLDVSAYNKGVYLYSLFNQNGEAVKTGKLTVN